MSTQRPLEIPESLLVLSDVHLGSDLNELTADPTRRSARVDADLVRLLEHYGRQPPAGHRWRLVVAGDFIDFIGMAIRPGSPSLETPPTEEELAHGLGNAEDHAREKLRRVAERHAEVFRALARFVEQGHALTLVHGNHDLELYWPGVRDELREVLLRHASPDVDRAAFLDRVEQSPWFFYKSGMAYIEHGHQYDPFCATDHVMAPLSPSHPRRLARGFCDVLLRFVVRPTSGISEHGHETMGIADYVAIGLKLGVRGAFDLALRFVRAILELFRLRREHLSDAAASLRQEHERRMALLAEAKRIGIDRLRALAALQSPPITRSIRGILASVLLDRLALALAASICLVVLALLGLRDGHGVVAAGLVLAAWLLAHRHLAAQREVCPAERLADRASHLARLFPAAFVVMGHTHVPVRVPVHHGAATYVNLGSWSEDEGGEVPAPRADRTHLVIHPRESGASGELYRWDPESGPLRFETVPPPRPE